MRSIEVTFDAETDAAIRAEWAALSAAGLPSLASHTGSSNRPHLTLAAGAALADSVALRSCFAGLPLRVRFGGLVVFGAGGRRFVLARQVVAAGALLELHRRVHAAAPGAVEQTLPDRWVPHVTLARRLDPAGIGTALTLIGSPTEPVAVAARLWDSVEKSVTALH